MKMSVTSWIAALGLVLVPVVAQTAPEAKNIALAGHNDVNGNGDGGEGLAIQQWPDGRRVLYLGACPSIPQVGRNGSNGIGA